MMTISLLVHRPTCMCVQSNAFSLPCSLSISTVPRTVFFPLSQLTAIESVAVIATCPPWGRNVSLNHNDCRPEEEILELL